jgi:glyoxylase-like metal-dependent hydrolase (beta-lactamase superfamily II)
MDALRMVSQVPVKGALDTHYHYDHSSGNAFFGANGIPLWAHANTAKRIVESYGAMQGADRAAFLSPLEKAVKDAKTEAARKHREDYLAHVTTVFNVSNSTVLALPNRPIEQSKLPMKVDLGGITAVIENYPGHSGTDMIVRVPEQNVVYAGDLLFSGMYPVTFDTQATVSGWRQTLKTFASWDKDTVFVPGHGPICGQEGVALSRALFDDIEDQAQKMHKAGVPAAEAADLYVVPEKYKNVAIFAWDFSIGPTITKLYAEWRAK